MVYPRLTYCTWHFPDEGASPGFGAQVLTAASPSHPQVRLVVSSTNRLHSGELDSVSVLRTLAVKVRDHSKCMNATHLSHQDWRFEPAHQIFPLHSA